MSSPIPTLNEIYYPIALEMGFVREDQPVSVMETLKWWQWTEMEDYERAKELAREQKQAEKKEAESGPVSPNSFYALFAESSSDEDSDDE